MHDLFRILPEEASKKLRRRAQPAWLNPMLATLTREPFSDPHWFFEAKLDGIRCLAFRKAQDVHLFSRNQLALNESFPSLITPLLRQHVPDFIVDGEIVAIENDVSRFELLQKRMLRVGRLFHDAAIETQPRKLAIHEPLWARGEFVHG